jgi:hypothetical protein
MKVTGEEAEVVLAALQKWLDDTNVEVLGIPMLDLRLSTARRSARRRTHSAVAPQVAHFQLMVVDGEALGATDGRVMGNLLPADDRSRSSDRPRRRP